MASNPKCLFFTGLFSFFLLSSALDMSIITYDNEKNTTIPARTEGEVLAMYESWLVKHGKAYNSIDEKEKRFEIFKDNLKFIDEHNSENHSYKVGLNTFADLTNEEFQTMYLRPRKNPKTRRLSGRKSNDWFDWMDSKDVPDSVDWREKGAAGPVRDQGSRGYGNYGWAFAAVSAFESKVKIVTANWTDMSVQQLIDCSEDSVKDAYEYLMNIRVIYTEKSYPYIGRPNFCKKKGEKAATLDGFTVFNGDSETLFKAVSNQPISTTMNAGGRPIQLYTSGNFDGKCGTSVQQEVTVVGYEVDWDSGTAYEIIKNSWGKEWGENGFMNVGGKQNSRDEFEFACQLGYFEKIMPFILTPPTSPSE